MFAGKKSIHQTCLYADQDGYADVLADMASGYMLFPKAWYCLDEISCYNLTAYKQHTYNRSHAYAVDSSHMHHVRPMMHACDTTLQASCVYMQLAAEVLHCHLHCKMHYQHKST